MRRSLKCIIALIPAVFSFLICSAGIVSEREAGAIARSLLYPDGVKSVLPAAKRFYVEGDTAPYCYLYKGNGGKGFAIISADDCVPPVIGHSDAGEFSAEALPPGLQEWMDMWGRIIFSLRGENAVPYTVAESSATSLSGTGKAAATGRKQLETAFWGQSSPFNDLCPDFGSGRCDAGCVCTSICILMKYFGYPSKGTGTLPEYTYTDKDGVERHIAGLTLGTPYAWDSMPLKYGIQSTSAQKEAVATLMRDVGIMMKSEYGTNGTAAYIHTISENLVRYMGFDKAAAYVLKADYTSSEWLALIRENIDGCGPLIYAGVDKSESGHQFIIDGYDGDKVHINWGWSGSGNGWYTFPAFDKYTCGHSAVLNLKPDEGGTTRPNLVLEGDGLSAGIQEFARGAVFSLKASHLLNYSFEAYGDRIAVAHVGGNNVIKDILYSGEVNLDAYSSYELNLPSIKIVSEINPGDYLALACEDGEEFALIPYDKENGTVGKIVMKRPDLAYCTSVSYIQGSKTLRVTAPQGTSFTVIYVPNGNPVHGGVNYIEDGIEIDFDMLVYADYLVRLECNGEKKEFIVKMGKK